MAANEPVGLQPLALQVRWNHRTCEPAVAGILDADARSFNLGLRREEGEREAFFDAEGAQQGTLLHQPFLLIVELGHEGKCCQRLGCVNIRIVLSKSIPDLQLRTLSCRCCRAHLFPSSCVLLVSVEIPGEPDSQFV